MAATAAMTKGTASRARRPILTPLRPVPAMTTFNGPADGGVTELLDISLRYITDQTIGVMREIGAFEAKSELGQLLDLVEAGEEVTITRRGHGRTTKSE